MPVLEVRGEPNHSFVQFAIDAMRKAHPLGAVSTMTSV